MQPIMPFRRPELRPRPGGEAGPGYGRQGQTGADGRCLPDGRHGEAKAWTECGIASAKISNVKLEGVVNDQLASVS